ncbi:MAG: HNH endonuclease [Planctomycetes bacterium]|nr:HNH endonuclease [Planctomycetota bacterium]MCB9828646.1 HNH endonuclease [Planctomycetota bacterium]MCB9901007.1 HNH endonuclease [Planctomycetota bacterium]
MRIGHFFAHVLGAPLANLRWSWGAHHEGRGHVYLRVWEDQIIEIDGEQQVLVARDRPGYRSPGTPERDAHLDLLRAGVPTFGVVCKAKNPSSPDNRSIRSFEDSYLLRLGEVSRDGADTYARVLEAVSLSAVLGAPEPGADLAEDLVALANVDGDATSREALVLARVGQGAFRTAVLASWGGRCAVTGVTTEAAIRASHIKPWRDSTDAERLDPENGLPLVATLDALFDARLISFAADGSSIVSDQLGHDDRRRLGVEKIRLSRAPSGATARYLEHHRTRMSGHTQAS